jgi:hypothetical protein
MFIFLDEVKDSPSPQKLIGRSLSNYVNTNFIINVN